MTVAVAGTNAPVPAVYFGVRSLMSGDFFRAGGSFFLRPENGCRFAIAFAFYRPATRMRNHVLVFPSHISLLYH